MNRTLSALFSALEAVIVVGVGLAIPLAPLTVMWGAAYGFAPDWTIFWRLSADVWLLGHGTDLTLTLAPALAKASGLAGAATPFTLGIAPLGFALITLLLGRRAGRRIDETHHRLLGEIVAGVVFALLSFGITVSASQPSARPNLPEGVILPTLVFVIGLLLARPAADLRPLAEQWPAPIRSTLMTTLRAGSAAAAIVTLVASVVLAVVIVGSYAQIITLYENLHSGALGGVALTVGELMFLPNLVIWTMSWLVGPGFAIGVGSGVSPLGTTLGPIPSIPVLGALPHGDFAFAFVGLVVPILAGFFAGVLFRGSPGQDPIRGRWMFATALGIGLVGGVLLGVLAWASSGAIGPGRLQVAGPDPIAVGLWSAAEIAVASLLGLLASSRGAGNR
jgi:hypothetical protein